MLLLSRELLIGSGSTRDCYYHPEYSDKCIKVLKKTSALNVNFLEYKYYQNLYSKVSNFNHLPVCYGFTNTTLGLGVIYDLILDQEQPALPFLDLIKSGQIDIDGAQKLVYELKEYLSSNGIVFCDPGLDNLVVSNGRLYIIDGLIHNKKTQYYMYRYIPVLKQWRTYKTIQILLKKVQRQFASV